MTDAPRSPFRIVPVVVTILLGPFGVGVLGNALVCTVLAALVAGIGVDDFLAAGASPDAMLSLERRITQASVEPPVLALSLVITFVAFAGSPILLARLVRAPVAPTLGLVLPKSALAFVLAPLAILGLAPLSDVLVRVARALAPNATFGALETIEQAVKDTPWFLGLVLFALLPGVGEEMLCRGFLQRAIARRRLAIAVSTLFFAALHLDPHHVAGVIPLGLLLAYVSDRTQSTLVPMAAHFSNNAMAVLATKFVAGEPEPVTAPYVFGGLALTAAALFGIRRLHPRGSAPSAPWRSPAEDAGSGA